MRTKPLLNGLEGRAFEVLEAVLRGTPYRAWGKTRLADVIEPSPGEEPSYNERSMLARGHFDFLVHERRGRCRPFLAVEVDGPHHQWDRTQMERDIHKNRLCMKAGLPLLRVDRGVLTPHDGMCLLEFMVQRTIGFERDWGAALAKAEEWNRPIAERPGMTKEEFFDECWEPDSFWEAEHQFPGIERVARRLQADFGIGSDCLVAEARSDEQYRFCGMGHTPSYDDDMYTVEHFYVVLAHRPGSAWSLTRDGSGAYIVDEGHGAILERAASASGSGGSSRWRRAAAAGRLMPSTSGGRAGHS